MGVETVELFVQCGSWQEAQRLADILTKQQLVISLELVPVQSRDHWKRRAAETETVQLIIQSRVSHTSAIAALLADGHHVQTSKLPSGVVVQGPQQQGSAVV